MTRIKSITILLLLVVFATSFVLKNEWYVYEHPLFSIEFPQKPSEKTQSVNSVIGELQMEMLAYDASKEEDDNIVYSLIRSEYPDSIVNSNKTELLDRFFRGAIDGGVGNVNGRLLAEKNITLNGFPGREAKIEFSGGRLIILLHTYLVYNKMYILQTVSVPEKENNANALRFHNSFKLK